MTVKISESEESAKTNNLIYVEDEEMIVLRYHGLLPRKEIMELLKEDGDWLVRCTEREGGQRIVITVKTKGDVKHIMLVRERDGYKTQDKTFENIVDLVDWYHNNKRPINKEGITLAGNPVRKKNWLVPSKDVVLDKKIGEGNFGEVFVGKLRFGKHMVPVAVKTCKALVGDDQRHEFMKEAKTMLYYRHRNVVRLYAVAADKPPLMLVMEHCGLGGLDGYLEKNKGKVPEWEKVQFCLEASRGMEYLAVSKQCVHRDLAARNCLLGSQHELKIADFGLTRQGTYKIAEDSAHKAVPVRWTAPESLMTGVFTFMSDVWSFGIMMWEIWADAAEPWPGHTVIQAFKAMKAGQKMEIPECVPEADGDLIKSCWKIPATERPTMTQIRSRLEEIAKDYKELDAVLSRGFDTPSSHSTYSTTFRKP